MALTPSGTSRDDREEQPEKVLSGISVTEGRRRDVREAHPEKAKDPMDETVPGRARPVRLLQPEKVLEGRA